MDNDSKSLTKFVGAAILARRKKRGFSQEQLAEYVGISAKSLARMEQGKIAPKFERLQLFALALDCRVVDLFSTPEATARESAESIERMMESLSVPQRAFLLTQIEYWTKYLVTQETKEGM